MKDLYNAM